MSLCNSVCDVLFCLACAIEASRSNPWGSKGWIPFVNPGNCARSGPPPVPSPSSPSPAPGSLPSPAPQSPVSIIVHLMKLPETYRSMRSRTFILVYTPYYFWYQPSVSMADLPVQQYTLQQHKARERGMPVVAGGR